MNNVIKILNQTQQQYWSPPITGLKTFSIQDYFKLEAVFCQRAIEHRVPRTKKLLKKAPNQTQSIVVLARAKKDIPELNLKKGDLQIIDGNTRKECWQDFELAGELRFVPQTVQALIHDISSKSELELVYYSYDSNKAVETNADKLSGACKAVGLNLQTGFLAKGGFVKALEYAGMHLEGFGDSQLEQVASFKNEIAALDGISPNKKYFDVTNVCGALMALKKYGCSPKVITGLDRINARISAAYSPTTGTDGVTWINKEWEEDKQFEDKLTDGINLPKQLDYWLFMFEKWMDNENVKAFRCASPTRGKGKRQTKFADDWYM